MKCYCKERKGHWYFRMRVPKELHPYLPSEISYSIKGLDLETARFRCKLLANRLRGIFEQAKYGVETTSAVGSSSSGNSMNVPVNSIVSGQREVR